MGILGEETRQPRFVGLASLDLRKHIEWRLVDSHWSDAHLERALEHENTRSWPDVVTRAPWRLLGYVSPTASCIDLAFSVHHALADGQSGQVFHQCLVEALNHHAGADNKDGVQSGPVLHFRDLPALTPPQEDLVRFTISWPFFLRTLWVELGPAWLRRVVALLTGSAGSATAVGPPAYVAPGAGICLFTSPLRPTRVRLVSLAPADAATLLAACRAHGTTLTPLLHGLMVVLCAREHQRCQESKAGDVVFSATTPASMRNHVTKCTRRDMRHVMGNYVSVYNHSWVAPPEASSDPDAALWAAVADVDAGLRTFRANLSRDNVMGLLSWVTDFHQWWRSKEGKARTTWEISNVGAMAAGGDTENNGTSWRLTRALFTFTAMDSGPLVGLTVSGIQDGAIAVAVVAQEGTLAEGVHERLRDEMQTRLQHFVETGTFWGGHP